MTEQSRTTLRKLDFFASPKRWRPGLVIQIAFFGQVGACYCSWYWWCVSLDLRTFRRLSWDKELGKSDESQVLTKTWQEGRNKVKDATDELFIQFKSPESAASLFKNQYVVCSFSGLINRGNRSLTYSRTKKSLVRQPCRNCLDDLQYCSH